MYMIRGRSCCVASESRSASADRLWMDGANPEDRHRSTVRLCLLCCPIHADRAGIPSYRTRVQYVPQRPSLLPGTPLELVSLLQSFSARRSTSQDTLEDAMRIAGDWDVEKTLWMRPWATLSGGEGQRVALAIALAAGGAELLLLDGALCLL
jgi:ABC-type phosphate transport system ATPase subunit